MAFKTTEDRNAWFRQRYVANRDRLRQYKIDKGCADCGYNAHHAALEFDHLPGFTKVDSVSRLIGRGWNSMMIEAKKCEVVCGNCHRIRTFNREQQSIKSRSVIG